MTAHTNEERLARLAQLNALLARVEELAQSYGPELASLRGYVEAARVEVAREIDRVHPAGAGVPTTAETEQRSAGKRTSILSDE